MSRYLIIISAIIPLLLFSLSCTKVVDIDLNAAAPKIIIEGKISDQLHSCNVNISRSVNYDEPNVFPTVTGSLVSISDDSGNTAILSETIAGTYSAPFFQGIAGKIYTISITAEGNTYKASSKMPSPVTINAIMQDSSRGSFGRPGITKFIKIQFNDPEGENNYYRIVQKINGIISDDIQIENDLLRDGNLITQGVEHNDPGLKTGDSVVVYLQTIDKEVFTYLSQLRETIGQGTRGPTYAPGTSPSNFDNGAIGYFSAFAVQSKSIIIK